MRAVIILFLAIIACAFFLATALAGGVGVAPTRLELEQAMRGGEYDRTIVVMNPGEEVAAYTLSASGDAGQWIRFYEDADSTVPMDRVSVPANERTTLVVRFAIPDDAASGRYDATIAVVSVPPELGKGEAGKGATGGAAVSVQASVAVEIEVTGTQILSGVVEGITAQDTEVNYPLRITVHFRNTGNVVANPEISVAIFKDLILIDNYSFTDAKIKPNSGESIPVEWQTKGHSEGEYVARVTVSLDGEVTATEDLAFQLLPVGTLTREGQLVSLSPEGEPVLGRILKILATFANTGQIESPAKFVGEVYRDGVLIESIESQELLVLAKNRAVLASYFKVQEPGLYTIKGQVNFGGKVTRMEEVSFDVVAPQVEPASSGAAETEPARSMVTGFYGRLRRETLLLLAVVALTVLLGTVANSVVTRRRRAD